MSWDVVTDQALPSREVSHFHFVRHGSVETGGQRLAYGQRDLPLSEEGLAQSSQMVESLVEDFPDICGVISSDLSRTRAIAEPLAEKLGVPLIVEAQLREQCMGAWEGRAWSELTAEDPAGIREFWSNYHRAVPPGGESLLDLSRRVQQFFQSRDAELSGGRYVVVAHIGVIRSVLCGALGLDLSEALRFAPQPSSHTWMIRAESGWVLQTMGERRVPVSQGPAQQAQKDRAMSDFRGDRAPRIALSGSAGVGKSTLGVALAKRLGVAYFPEGMRGRIESGLDIRSLGHEQLRSLIWELWQEQVAREDAALAAGEGFVSDRSPVDYLAFWMNYGFVHDAEESQRFADSVLARVGLYDRVILLPFGCLPLAADGVRSSNPWIQMRFHSTLRGLLEEHVSAPRFVHLPELVDLSQRLAWCEDLVTRAGEYARREGG